MDMILKVATGVFLGMLLWSKKDEFGWIAEVIAIGAFAIIVLGILRESISEYGAKFFQYRRITRLASDLTRHELADGISSSSIATILQRHEESRDIERLIEKVDQYKIRKSNGYEPDEEIQSIRSLVQRIVDSSKKYGWTPSS